MPPVELGSAQAFMLHFRRFQALKEKINRSRINTPEAFYYHERFTEAPAIAVRAHAPNPRSYFGRTGSIR